MEQADPVEQLFALAKQHRIPMAEICRKANVAPTTPSRWKRGKHTANLATVRELQEALAELATAA